MSGESKTDKAAEGKVELMMGVVRGRYGERLSAAQLEETRDGVRAIVKASDAMHAVSLDNGDIPFAAPPHRGD